jgi:ABC-type nitrate/sulfonate/bicarbonate transport system substrate-binding protein
VTALRFMTWCPGSVTGMHLPAFAAADAGLFAEHGLEVEFLASADAPRAVAAGDADVALTSAVHVLHCQTHDRGRLAVRFVAAWHQRNPIAAVVRSDSGRSTPADLAGARAASWSIPWYAREYAAALAYRGIAAPRLVHTPGALDAALGSGAVDVLPMWIDDTAPARALGMALHHDGETFDVRAIALDIPVYSTGLIAADRVEDDVVRALLRALVAGHELQRERPQDGVAGFCRRFPDVTEQHARISWELYEPYAFDGGSPGAMDAARWRETVAYTARGHDLTALDVERVFRPELAAIAERS